MLTIATDVDDTLLSLVPPWLDKYNRLWQDNISSSDIHSWDIGSYTKAGKEFYNLLTPDLYDDILMVKGSLSGVRYLRSFGRVIFVTSGFGNNGKAKFDALNRLGFEVSPNDFVEATDKSLIRADCLIDDNFDNCYKFPGVGILYTRPWNIKNYFSFRVSNWNDIMNFFAEETII